MGVINSFLEPELQVLAGGRENVREGRCKPAPVQSSPTEMFSRGLLD